MEAWAKQPGLAAKDAPADLQTYSITSPSGGYIIAEVRAHTPKMNVHGDTRLWCASTRMLPIVCASSNNVVKSVKGQVLGIALHRSDRDARSLRT